jgi:hypothetical protein
MAVIDTEAELVMALPFCFNVRSLSLSANVEVLYTEIVVLLYSTEMTVN